MKSTGNKFVYLCSLACQGYAKQWNLNLEAKDFVLIFKELIQKTAQSYGRVVILIDECDKPIIDYLEKEKRAIAEENRSILRQFYSIIKGADRLYSSRAYTPVALAQVFQFLTSRWP